MTLDFADTLAHSLCMNFMIELNHAKELFYLDFCLSLWHLPFLLARHLRCESIPSVSVCESKQNRMKKKLWKSKYTCVDGRIDSIYLQCRTQVFPFHISAKWEIPIQRFDKILKQNLFFIGGAHAFISNSTAKVKKKIPL